MRIKTILLAIVTVITFGLTSCTEEFGGDNTQGKPGYLTINVKTLKLNQNKVLSDDNTANDYTKINNLNIFVFDAAGDVLLQKWISTTYTSGSNISIPVSTLATGATGDKVVAVANFGSDMFSITTMAQLTSTTIGTVGDFGTNGLHMTGQADIASTEGGGYESQVKIAPVEAKISVNWNLSSFVAQHYEVTGIYIVNAISETTLPIIRNSISNHEDATPTWQNTEDFTTTNLISKTDKAQTGFAQDTWTDAEYKFYELTDNLKSDTLFNKIALTGLTTPSSPTGGTYHYYVGENYSYNSTGVNRNTIVLIEVSPKVTDTTIPTGKVRYYTYELDKTSTTYNNPLTTATNITTPVSIASTIDPIITNDGFSTRRKVHYNLTFNLNSLGSEDPFKKIKSLNVVVTAEAWDDGSHAIAF